MSDLPAETIPEVSLTPEQKERGFLLKRAWEQPNSQWIVPISLTYYIVHLRDSLAQLEREKADRELKLLRDIEALVVERGLLRSLHEPLRRQFYDSLPDWFFCKSHVEGGTACALERFIHENEPAGNESEAKFRSGLLEVLNEVRADFETAPPSKSHETKPAEPKEQLLDWSLRRWHESVADRPLVNVHRRTLDDIWREVIAFAGGDPESLIGPRHDAMLAEQAARSPETNQQP